MPELEPFCTIEGQMSPRMVGRTPAGVRIDFPFQGVATGPHWEGERPVSGVDYATVRADGNMDLDIHGVIGEKRDSVGYTATGVSVVLEDQSAEINELLKFHTGSEDLAWLNDRIGVAIGRGAEGKITLEVYLVKRA
ncbi:MAG TPA: DUF3237 family protein [Acidimicrobiia bacterium]|jgi:hypothetical protein|nr:DUF3237 family protein [Acidimicrobiia bacterium]